MNLHYGRTKKLHVLGHEGDTYGFMSAQGYIPSLKGAFSIVANMENSNGAPMEDMACLLLQTVYCELGSKKRSKKKKWSCSLGCRQFESELAPTFANNTLIV